MYFISNRPRENRPTCVHVIGHRGIISSNEYYNRQSIKDIPLIVYLWYYRASQNSSPRVAQSIFDEMNFTKCPKVAPQKEGFYTGNKYFPTP